MITLKIGVVMAIVVILTYVTAVISTPSQPRRFNVTRQPDGDIIHGFPDCDSFVAHPISTTVGGQQRCKCNSNGTFYSSRYLGDPALETSCWPYYNDAEYNVTTEDMSTWGISYVNLYRDVWTKKLSFVKSPTFYPPQSTLYKLEKWCTLLELSNKANWIRFADEKNDNDQFKLGNTAADYFSIYHQSDEYYLYINTSKLYQLSGRLVALKLDCTENGTYVTDGEAAQYVYHSSLQMLLKFAGTFEYMNLSPPLSLTKNPLLTTTYATLSATDGTATTRAPAVLSTIGTTRKESKSSSNTAAIIGSSVGGTVLLVLLCIIVIVYIKRRSSGMEKYGEGGRQQTIENQNVGGIYTAPSYAYPNLNDSAYINPNTKPIPRPKYPSTSGLAPNAVPPVPRSPRPTQRPLSTNLGPAVYVDMTNGDNGEDQYTELTEYRNNNNNSNNNKQQQYNDKCQDQSIYAGLNELQNSSNNSSYTGLNSHKNNNDNSNEDQSADYLDLTATDNNQVNRPSSNTSDSLDNNGHNRQDQQYADLRNTPSSNQQQNYSSLANNHASSSGQAYQDLMY